MRVSGMVLNRPTKRLPDRFISLKKMGLMDFSSCKKLQDQGGVKILSMMQVDGVKDPEVFEGRY